MIFDPLGPYCPAAAGLAWAFRPACSRLVCAAAGIEPRRPRRVESAPEARSFPAPRTKRRPERVLFSFAIILSLLFVQFIPWLLAACRHVVRKESLIMCGENE
ncbi:hypothetical protein NDU88_010972 [Pleurodeles waltl]|uniref:Uncharacterized protein n=1 Tax=Pleurodeles waltl TaxID=8319 RepID=A0AAV7QXH1_PLEWA|nr:hypothetical protein NDU88_010972 [Pleurodeles waltl]